MQPNEIQGLFPASAAPAAPEPSEELGQEDFLRMLIAQLENQDPLDPQDATEFTAQLAQFSSLDQLVSMRSALEDVAGALVRSDVLGAANLIGELALVESGTFEVSSDPEAPRPELLLELDAATEVRAVEIRDAAGRLVSRLEGPGALGPGRYPLEWSAFDSPPPAGLLRFEVAVAPGETAPTRLVRAPVTGAAAGEGSTVRLFGEAEVPVSKLREVGR